MISPLAKEMFIIELSTRSRHGRHVCDVRKPYLSS